jgi:aminoglycoside phosphotransferase (APT) family kinase protein
MIPPEKSEAVARCLMEAFGTAQFENIERITVGQTASLVFRIVVHGSPYLLKIITRAENPTRHYTSMKAAAAAGIAPGVRYVNIEEKISITDFVNARPLPASEALVRLPALLRTLHALPPFDKAPFNTTCTFLLDKGPALDGWIQRFQAANVLPETDSQEFFARYAEIAAVYTRNPEDQVASHNDLFKPDNILFDGRRVWLVDWEAAFRNDRYADLAALANQLVESPDEELIYLREYFKAEPNEHQRARFHLMQQLSHLFYTTAFLTLGSAGKPVDWSQPVPGFRDYQQRLWQGTLDLSANDEKIVLG